MPIHSYSGSYRAYSPGLVLDTQRDVFEDFVGKIPEPLDCSPSKTLHLYERRQLPPLPSPSVTDSVLDDYESLDTASVFSDLESPPSQKLGHIANYQRKPWEQETELSSQLSLFPMPLRTERQIEQPSLQSIASPQYDLRPPVSKFSAPFIPPEDITAADVPPGASMELEKHHSSWSIAVYSSTNTIALFRLPIDRNRVFMRKQNSKGMSRVAMICAGSQDTLKVSVTGYLDKPSELPAYQLSNSLWTCKVFSLCQKIGHSPALSLHDNGIAGLHNSCHAEKQAVAYLHYQHPQLRKATIHLSDDPCSDCARFLRKYQLKCRKEFDLVVYGWKWQDQAVGRHFGTTLRTML